MSFNLIFMQIRLIIIQFDLEFVFLSIFRHNRVRLGLEFPPKLQLDFPTCFLHVANHYFNFFYFYFEKKWILGNNPELGYDTHNHITITPINVSFFFFYVVFKFFIGFCFFCFIAYLDMSSYLDFLNFVVLWIFWICLVTFVFFGSFRVCDWIWELRFSLLEIDFI